MKSEIPRGPIIFTSDTNITSFGHNQTSNLLTYNTLMFCDGMYINIFNVCEQRI